MSILRPTSYGLWASGASGNVVEPIVADKAQGFVPTGIARSSYANWLWGIHGQWNQYVDEQVIKGQGTVAALGVGPTNGLSNDAPAGAARISNFIVVGPSNLIAPTGPTGCIVVSASAGATMAPTPQAPRGVVFRENLLFAGGNILGGVTLSGAYNCTGFTRTSAGNMIVTFATPADYSPRLAGFGSVNTVAGTASVQALGATNVAISFRNLGGSGIDTTGSFAIFHF